MTDMPVLAVLDELRAALADPGAAVLVAPPGTGKTTGLPPALLDEPWLAGGRVLVLEPRRLAARAAATRMAAVHGSAVGERFGYSVRGERRSSAATRVEVVTEGLFLRRLQSDPTLEGIGAVVLDEFHERSLDLDLALTLLLDVRAALRPDLRVLVMSATIAPEPVAVLLGDPGRPAPVIEATAPAFEVVTRYRPGSAHDPIERRVAEVVAEAWSSDPGDLLVFLPGRPEIHRTERELTRRAGGDAELRIEQLHGSLSPAEQERVVHPDPQGRRRVVLSTSLAETSITVPGVRVVVDAGRRRAVRTDAHTGLPALTTGPVSRAGADQRRGRAGRTATGVAYRLWSEADDRHRPALDTPEILDGDLAPLLLQLRAWGVDDPGTLRWLDAPPPHALDHAATLLQRLGALDDDHRLTSRGRAMAGIGFHPRLAAVALAGRELGRTDVAAEVLAVLETSRSGDVDLAERVRTLRNGDATGDARHALRQWRRTLADGGRSRDDAPGAVADLDETVARLLLAGYPDRVARRRRGARTDDRGRARTVFHLRSGGEVAVPGTDHPFERAEWLVVADLDGGTQARDGRMHLAAVVAESVVLDELGDQVEVGESVEWDPDRDDVVASRVRRLGAITLDRAPLKDPSPASRRRAVADAIAREGLSLLGRYGEADELRARVALLRAVDAPGGAAPWPDWSDETLAAQVQDWLGDRLDRARGRRDLARIDVRGVLEQQLAWDQTRVLGDAAPTHWELASGRRVPLRYGEVDGEPATVLASVRLRDVLGTDEHPTVAGGRVPVTVELLSPAGRPVQRTTDLPGFWRGSYAAVRSELRGRYPKHPWPERPWEPLPPGGRRR
ncbi:MAG: ATP-dependent helicase HrpB [Microthrixaceae bacterium]